MIHSAVTCLAHYISNVNACHSFSGVARGSNIHTQCCISGDAGGQAEAIGLADELELSVSMAELP